MNRHHWPVIAGALLLAVIVGLVAYNAGISHGIQQSGKLINASYPYAHHWPHPHGFFFFGPFFFIVFTVIALRMLFWRGGWQRGRCGNGGDRLEEWHRQAHERMKDA